MTRWLTEDEIVGMDLEWFGCDSCGQLGYFVLCMVGRIPVSVASDAAGLEAVTDYFEHLPKIGEAIPKVQLEKDYQSDWIDAAEKGFYAFDGSSGAYPVYKLIAVPERPLRLSDLKPEFAEIVARTKTSIEFGENDSVEDDQVFGPLTSGRKS